VKDKFIWNARKNISVRASRIRNFTIDEEQGVFVITAWINNDETLKMGIEETKDAAVAYLDDVHKQIEEIG
jgi:hypothetical protein